MLRSCFFIIACHVLTIPGVSQPVIRSFIPVSGNSGTPVTIEGTGFSTTPANNIVYFGAVRASVAGATDTTLFVTVPEGATYQVISVSVSGLAGFSKNPFVVTFDGDGGSFISNSFLPKVDFSTGMYPHSSTLADFNNDGKADVLVARGSSDKVSVFRNTSQNGNIQFDNRQDFATTGFNHEGCSTADFDGDGKLDFVITNSHNLHSISVYRNNSSSSFISFDGKIDFAAENTPYSVATGDIDLDGKPDIAVVNASSDKLSVYRNTSTPGQISFDNRIDIPVAYSPYGIAIGDLNDDGKPEIVFTTQAGTSSIYVLKNMSTGSSISFGTPVAFASFAGPFTVSIGDLDSDGRPDLVAAGSGANSVITLRNTSDGGNLSFSLSQYFNAGNYPVCVSISDVNGDGKPDLVACNRYSEDVSVLKNISNTGVILFEQPVSYPVGDDPFFVSTGDLDGDSRPDIIACNSANTVISVLRNLSGYDVAPVVTSFSPTSGIQGTVVTINGSNFENVTSVKFGNIPASSFNIDSSSGITATLAGGASGAVSVINNFGTGTLDGFTFNGPIIYSFSPAVAVAGTVVTISGVNFTGTTEVKFGETPATSFTVNNNFQITATVANGSSGTVSVATPNGKAELPGFSFGAPTITSIDPLFGPVGSTVAITGTSFDPTPANNTVFFGAVKATVSVASPTQLIAVVPAGATYQPVSVTANRLTAYSPLPFSVSFNSDTTQITHNSFAIAANIGTGVYPFAIAMCDFNDDGKPDLVTANSVSNNVSVIKNDSRDGSLSFVQKIDLVSGPDPKRIATADLDGDGKKEIIVSNANAGLVSTISIFRNTSTGGAISFDPKMDVSTGNGSIGLAVAELNGDGKPDIVVTSGNSGFFSIFINTTAVAGAITFAAKEDYTLFSHPDNVITADMDKDGRTDIIVVGSASPVITVFRNLSTGGNFAMAQVGDHAVENFPSFISTGDIDGDQKLDVLVTNYSSGTVSLLTNLTTGSYIYFAPNQNLTLPITNVAVADLNGDRKPDLLAGQYLTGNISVLENSSAGIGFPAFADTVNFTTGTYDTYVAAGDLDGDGKPELAVANTIPNTITILKNRINLPTIASVSETASRSGTTIAINGTNLSGATDVKFGGTSARSFTVVSSTKINAEVGAGASGNITVLTAQGTASIAGFQFFPDISASGPTTFCGDKVVVLSSSAEANNQWYRDGAAISGATSKTLQVNTGGTYTVRTTSNGITTTSPSGITVTVTTTPRPVITRDANNNLVSSATSGNQWYFNGTMINGASNQTYLPAQDGFYTVTSTINGCTSEPSADYNFVLTGIINLGNGQYLKFYPNPIRDKLYFNWNISNASQLQAELMDLHGRLLFTGRKISNGSFLDLSHLSPGVYLLKIHNKPLRVSETIKIVKH